MSSIIPAPELGGSGLVTSVGAGLTLSSGEVSLAPIADAGAPGALVDTIVEGRAVKFCHHVQMEAINLSGFIGETTLSTNLWQFDGSKPIRIDRVLAIVESPFTGTPADLTIEVGIDASTDVLLDSFSGYTDPSKGLTLADTGTETAGGDPAIRTAAFNVTVKYDVTSEDFAGLTDGLVSFYIEGVVYP